MERFEFQFSSSTVEPPTGSQIRLNNTDPTLATKVWVRDMTTPGEDVHNVFTVQPPGSAVYVQDYDNHTRYTRYQSTGATIERTGYVEMPITWVASGLPLLTQKVSVILVAPADVTPLPGPPTVPYVEKGELQRVLQKTTPTAAESDAMDRVLEASAGEINWDLSYTATSPAPASAWPILADVNLDRATELWRFNYSTIGVLPVGPEQTPIVAPRDTWYRHHLRLNPLRASWGVA